MINHELQNIQPQGEAPGGNSMNELGMFGPLIPYEDEAPGVVPGVSPPSGDCVHQTYRDLLLMTPEERVKNPLCMSCSEFFSPHHIPNNTSLSIPTETGHLHFYYTESVFTGGSVFRQGFHEYKSSDIYIIVEISNGETWYFYSNQYYLYKFQVPIGTFRGRCIPPNEIDGLHNFYPFVQKDGSLRDMRHHRQGFGSQYKLTSEENLCESITPNFGHQLTTDRTLIQRTVQRNDPRSSILATFDFLISNASAGSTVVYIAHQTQRIVNQLSVFFPNVKFVPISPYHVQYRCIPISGEFGPQIDNAILKYYKKCLLICDINSVGHSLGEQPAACLSDMDNQRKIYEKLKPTAALLSFELPWTPGETSYLRGDLNFPVWADPHGRRCFLKIQKYTGAKNTYRHDKYAKQMYYFNRYYRSTAFITNLESFDRQQDFCFDCVSEKRILSKYSPPGDGSLGHLCRLFDSQVGVVEVFFPKYGPITEPQPDTGEQLIETMCNFLHANRQKDLMAKLAARSLKLAVGLVDQPRTNFLAQSVFFSQVALSQATAGPDWASRRRIKALLRTNSAFASRCAESVQRTGCILAVEHHDPHDHYCSPAYQSEKHSGHQSVGAITQIN